jgi:serine/threonine protein kinase
LLHGEKKAQPTYSFLRSLPGGSGEVSVVWHDVFKREMVQKTINVLGVEDAVAYREPQLLDRIDHPRIVRIREAQHDPDIDGAVTLVSEYLPEGSVHDALTAGTRFGVRQALTAAADLADALDHLHHLRLDGHAGFLHRDVKPGNVLLDANGSRGLLTDLGSAAPLDPDGTCAAHAGTLLYRPPEYAVGTLTVRSDLYGVGMVLLEMLSGAFPYALLDPLKMEKAAAAGRRTFPDRLVVFGPSVNDKVRRAIRCLIAADPSRRPASASEAAGMLRAAKTIGWCHDDGDGLDGEWTGVGVADRRGHAHEYRVQSRVLRAGASAGKRKVLVFYRDAGGGWRRVVADRLVDADDDTGVRDAFADAHSHAFQR